MPRLAGRPRFLSHSLLETLVDLHGAIDPETGHLTCHYYAIAPVIVEINGRSFPGLNVGECMTIVVDPEAAEAAEEESEKISLSELHPEKGVDGRRVDPASLALALSFVRHSNGALKILAPRSSDDSVIIIYDSGEDDKLTIIIWKCKEKNGKGAILQV